MPELNDLFCLIGPKAKKYLLRYDPEGNFSTHDGRIDFCDIHDWGVQVATNRGVRYQVIRPTAADLAMGVRRKTTISYPKDIGFQMLHSTMSAGSTVLECGGGSGAMTSVLARFVGDDGMIHVFERRPEFLALQKKNLERYGLAHRVTWHEMDPAEEGSFGLDPDSVDAAFIDVPEPWALVKPVHDVLRGGCSSTFISPSMEQVRQTVDELRAVGFTRLWSVELLERELLVRRVGTRPKESMHSHTGYLTFAARFETTVDEMTGRNPSSSMRKERSAGVSEDAEPANKEDTDKEQG